MRSIFKYIVVAVAILPVVGCDPVEIDADLPDRDGLITVTSLFGADSTWRVDVTQSKSILKTMQVYGLGLMDAEPYTNAEVTVRENGQPHDNLVYSPVTYITESWAYRSSKPEIHPIPGKTYDIEVTVPNVGKATSTCFVPAPAPLLSVVAGKDIVPISTPLIYDGIQNSSFIAVPAEIVIDDPAGENYYEVIIKFQYDVQIARPFLASPTFTKDLRFHNTGLSPTRKVISSVDENYYSVIFRDQDTQAKQLKVPIMMPVQYDYVDGKYELRRDVGHLVVLRTLSKEYFQYISTQELQAYSQDNPFAQPVVIYGNIKGGLGIFAGFSESAMKVEFP